MGAVDVAPDFTMVAAAITGRSGEIGFWDTRTASMLSSLRLTAASRDVRFWPDGRRLAVVCEESVSIFEL
jgi:hypothetical protein